MGFGSLESIMIVEVIGSLGELRLESPGSAGGQGLKVSC